MSPHGLIYSPLLTYGEWFTSLLEKTKEFKLQAAFSNALFGFIEVSGCCATVPNPFGDAAPAGRPPKSFPLQSPAWPTCTLGAILDKVLGGKPYLTALREMSMLSTECVSAPMLR